MFSAVRVFKSFFEKSKIIKKSDKGNANTIKVNTIIVV